jgi:hypothetical protein
MVGTPTSLDIREAMMGFLRRLFGGKQDEAYVDKRGIYFYMQCNNCGSQVRVRADKHHDLNRDGDGYVWHKTIVDSQCFRHIPVIVYLDRNYRVISYEIEGGEFITQDAYATSDAAGE